MSYTTTHNLPCKTSTFLSVSFIWLMSLWFSIESQEILENGLRLITERTSGYLILLSKWIHYKNEFCCQFPSCIFAISFSRKYFGYILVTLYVITIVWIYLSSIFSSILFFPLISIIQFLCINRFRFFFVPT